MTIAEQHTVEENLVEYHDIFSRHRMDTGMNTELVVKLAPRVGKPVYSQSLPMPINVKQDVLMEVVLKHKY